MIASSGRKGKCLIVSSAIDSYWRAGECAQLAGEWN